ncbi:hypothetical protein [Micromonospora halotolerans]|uniref:hypothetical protein n=1 Tax=Micromonospora halotolerans TaxID=709879 RepID=UPI0035E41FC0
MVRLPPGISWMYTPGWLSVAAMTTPRLRRRAVRRWRDCAARPSPRRHPAVSARERMSQIVTDDMPFLVDSVTARSGCGRFRVNHVRGRGEAGSSRGMPGGLTSSTAGYPARPV